MTVFFVLCFFGIIAFIIPRKFLNIYLMLASMGIAAVYFWFVPPYDYDLYRHYEVLEFIEKYSFEDLFSTNATFSMEQVNDYSISAKVYLAFAYIISKIPIDNFLPVFVGTLIYALMSFRIVECGKVESASKWKIALCFFFILCCADFRSVSGIRNMLAYAVFAFIAYEDMVNKRNKIVCFLCYLLLVGVHTSVLLLIVLRLLVKVCKSVSVWVVGVFVLGAYMMLDVIVSLLQEFAVNNMGSVLLFYIVKYSSGDITEYNTRKVAIRGLIMIVYLLIYLFDKYQLKIPEKYSDYGRFFVLTFLFTFGSISQYDVFIRNDLVLLFLLVPFLIYFYGHFVSNRFYIVYTDSGNAIYAIMGVTIYILSFIIMLLSLTFYVRFFYLPMDVYFNF